MEYVLSSSKFTLFETAGRVGGAALLLSPSLTSLSPNRSIPLLADSLAVALAGAANVASFVWLSLAATMDKLEGAATLLVPLLSCAGFTDVAWGKFAVAISRDGIISSPESATVVNSGMVTVEMVNDCEVW